MSMTAEEARKKSNQYTKPSKAEGRYSTIIKLIDKEIEQAASGGEGSIDYSMIKLYDEDVKFLVDYYSNLGYVVFPLGNPRTDDSFGEGYLHILWGGLVDIS